MADARTRKRTPPKPAVAEVVLPTLAAGAPPIVININLEFSPKATLPTVEYVADFVKRLRAAVEAEPEGPVPFEPEDAS